MNDGGALSATGSRVSGGAGDELGWVLKCPRLVWTLQLHKRFVDAVGLSPSGYLATAPWRRR